MQIKSLYLNADSSRPRLTNSDLDGFRIRPMSASIHEHFFMSSQTDLGSPAIVASSNMCVKTMSSTFAVFISIREINCYMLDNFCSVVS